MLGVHAWIHSYTYTMILLPHSIASFSSLFGNTGWAACKLHHLVAFDFFLLYKIYDCLVPTLQKEIGSSIVGHFKIVFFNFIPGSIGQF